MQPFEQGDGKLLFHIRENNLYGELLAECADPMMARKSHSAWNCSGDDRQSNCVTKKLLS